MSQLVLLRHGESEWNAKGLFTGWVDVGLSAAGGAEAQRGGTMLAESGPRIEEDPDPGVTVYRQDAAQRHIVGLAEHQLLRGGRCAARGAGCWDGCCGGCWVLTFANRSESRRIRIINDADGLVVASR